ncbi:MAG TPA: HDOD domain-containing protein [Steroidobacteraceae bacterium]|nr:HDOD domain-containing protein [Steroidobacteraceae bacterium]
MSIADADIIRAARSLGVIGGGNHSAPAILAALCDTSLDARQIAAVILRDPGLAARVLKVANSAFYGRSRNIGSVDRALMLLGLDAVRTIAAAACLEHGTPRTSMQAPIDPRALSRHCVASAFAAESLGRQSGRGTPAEAFMAGLLHDFGVPVQERLDSAGVIGLLQALAADPQASPAELEETLVQVGHARCAAVIFEDWRLPEAIVMAVRHHDAPTRAPPPLRDMALLVHLGVQLALQAGFAHPLEPRPGRTAHELLLRSLGLREEAVKAIVDGLAERVQLVTEGAA